MLSKPRPWRRLLVSRLWPCTPSRSPLGAHTHWHTHPKGQGLYVTDGVALVHIEGQAPQHLAEGESIWINAGQRHWHGATPERAMTHVAYQQAADDLSTIDWQEPVTPTTYSHATKENH